MSSLAYKSAIGFLLFIQASLLVYSATTHSPTYLEPAFLASGISHWQFGRFELYRVNPPLARMVAALPVLATGYEEDWTRFYETPGARAEFPVGEDFFKANGRNMLKLVTYARWACIPFNLLGAYFAFRWAKELYGTPSGLVALTLFVFEPNLLAHGELITPDMACTSLGILAGYAFWRWLKNPSWAAAAIAGSSLGLAELSKMSWLILFLLWPALWITWRMTDRSPACTSNDSKSIQISKTISNPPAASTRKPPAGQLALILLIAVYLINFVYGFDGTGTQLKSFEFVSRSLTGLKKSGEAGNRFRDSIWGELPMPVPRQYMLGFDCQKKDFEYFPHQSYLRGEWRDHGWWYYYLYGLLVKVPCGIWIMLGLVVTARMCGSSPVSLRDEMILLIPAIALLILISSQTEFSIHLRYAFPALGLILISVAQAGRWINRKTLVRGSIVLSLLAYSTISCVITYPNHLRYFNDFVGGSIHGKDHLLGSSYDWGQDLNADIEWTRTNYPNTRLRFEILFPVFGEALLRDLDCCFADDHFNSELPILTLRSADNSSKAITKSQLTSRNEIEHTTLPIVYRFPSGNVLSGGR